MSASELMISVSGVRGRVGFGLTPEITARYAAAFGAWALRTNHARTIVLGRDSRVSGPLFHQVARASLEAVGADVMDLGLTTTPTLQMAVGHHRAAGGLCITASHNPIEWNALKFVGPDGLFLSEAQGAAMRSLLDRGIPYAAWDQLGKTQFDADAITRHLQAIVKLPFLNVEAIRARGFRVAYDGCRGAGGAIIPRLLELLGCEVHEINVETDGRFPRPPEPVPEHLGDLGRLVRETDAQVGIATDPDVDRLAIVAEDGRAIGEDYTLAFACRVVLRRRKGPVVTNLSTSRVVDDVVAGFGQRVVRAPVGEAHVALRMREERAVVGGEGNGGVILPDLHLGRDAPLAAALVLQLLLEDARPLSAVVAGAPRYAIIKDKIPPPAAPIDAVYASLRHALQGATADTQDGLRLDWPDRWLHVRPSGTEPVVRIIAEAPTRDDARRLVDRARELFASLA
jgi:phosphomannomutase